MRSGFMTRLQSLLNKSAEGSYHMFYVRRFILYVETSDQPPHSVSHV